VASDEYSLAKAKGDLTLALTNLAQMLNLPTPDDFDVAPLEETSAAPASLDYDGIIERWPSIVAAKSSIEANKAQVDVARSGYYPTLSFEGYVKTYYVNMFHTNIGWGGFGKQFFDSNLNEVVGLHLNIPIFNRFQTRSNIRTAKLNLMDQQLALDDARQNLRTEIHRAYTNTKVALDKLTAAQKAVDAAAVSVSYEQDRYDAGRSSVFDLINAQQKHLNSQQDAVQAKYEYLIRQRILNFYR
jgi:outer membrane protein